MSAPAVSVVIPTRNRRELLARALASVRGQTFSDFEILVVDDASTDSTPEYVQQLATEDPRVRVIRNAAPAGPAAARNRGVDAARGEWLAFLDDDDEWLPRRLELQLAQAADADVVYSSFLFVDAEGREHVYGEDVTASDVLRRLARGNVIGNSTVLVRTTMLQAHGGFDEAMPMIEDWELWLRLARHARFHFVAQPVARIHHSADGVTSRGVARLAACARIEDCMRPVTDADPQLHAALLDGLAFELITAGLHADGRHRLRRALRIAPMSARRWIMTIAAHAGTYTALTALHRTVLEWLRTPWRRPVPPAR